MKKNNNILLISGIALAGAGAYFLYKKKEKTLVSANDILERQLAEQKADALKIIANNKKNASVSLENKNSMKSKIAVIQGAIGVTPDGIVGPQTLNQLKTFFPMLVNLTNANIERIYTYVQANKYVTPTAKVVDLDYGKTMQTPLIVQNNNSGVNVFTDTFKPF